VPSMRPFDLFHPERHHGVKLYVRRVFITDRAEGLVPGWLRFLRGVVDSQDLPLNVSREMLQNNPVLTLIRNGLVSRVIAELEKKAKDDAAEYAKFWDNFGPVLKEGLYEDVVHQEALLGLARFRSTATGDAGGDALVSHADYIGRMKEGQDAIFYIAGEDAAAVAASPQLEGFRKRGVEVLLMTDPVDEFWIGRVGKVQGKELRSVTRGAAELSKIKQADGATAEPAESPDAAPLIALFRLALEGEVKDVRASDRLTDSAVCLVADERDMDIHLERLLRQHKQLDAVSKRILEINPAHPLMRKLAADLAQAGADPTVQPRLSEIAHLLLDQARIVEGERPADPAAFARRLASVLAG
jgi:molecular chaperone HtpG